jgi:two-component system LytT family response regulator
MTSDLRVVIVDDEPLARTGLRLRLGFLGGVDVVAECGGAEAALKTLGSAQVDAVFADIQMPGLDGFDLVERTERGLLPAIVFVTAFREHALRAFGVGAFDYLLKPFDDATLAAVVDRLRTFVSVARPTTVPAPTESLVVRRNGEVHIVQPAEIEWVEAVGDHVRVHAHGASHQLRSTMHAMEARLDARQFVRVHRGAIVAVRVIRALQPYSRGEHLVVLADGTKLPLSRRNRGRVLAVLQRSPLAER